MELSFVIKNHFHFCTNKKSFNLLPSASDIEQCEYDDNYCFKSSFNQVVQKYYKTGYPEIGLSTLDPLRLEDIISERDDTKPVSIALKATDIKFFGLNKMTISKIT